MEYDFKNLKDEEIYTKIAELNKRIAFYSNMGNVDVLNQLRNYLEILRNELSERILTNTTDKRTKRVFKRPLMAKRRLKSNDE
jgi:hypothetical protein